MLCCLFLTLLQLPALSWPLQPRLGTVSGHTRGMGNRFSVATTSDAMSLLRFARVSVQLSGEDDPLGSGAAPL